ncbi:hypothetical protein WG908_02630 [Sphingobium sp. AN641]|uniref:hypothetical protein n=1 Tax=Sphingobium sp. AN641 TaxID=3133443 RepID=UPI0030C578EE
MATPETIPYGIDHFMIRSADGSTALQRRSDGAIADEPAGRAWPFFGCGAARPRHLSPVKLKRIEKQ